MIDISFDFTLDSPNYWDGFWERNNGLGAGKTELDKAIRELIDELSADPAAIFLMYLLHTQKHNPQEIKEDDLVKAVRACISYVFRVRLFKGSISNQFFALAIQYYEKAETEEHLWNALDYMQVVIDQIK